MKGQCHPRKIRNVRLLRPRKEEIPRCYERRSESRCPRRRLAVLLILRGAASSARRAFVKARLRLITAHRAACPAQRRYQRLRPHRSARRSSGLAGHGRHNSVTGLPTPLRVLWRLTRETGNRTTRYATGGWLLLAWLGRAIRACVTPEFRSCVARWSANLVSDVLKCARSWLEGVYLAISFGGWSRRVKMQAGAGRSRAGRCRVMARVGAAAGLRRGTVGAGCP